MTRAASAGAAARRGSAESLAAPPATDAALLVVALVGVSFSGPLMAATAAPALAIALWRNAFGAGVTAAVALRSPRRFAAAPRRALLTSAAAGVALAAHFGTWVPSLTLTSVASATALVCTQTVWTGVIALALGRRLPRLAWIGMAVATVGAALITGTDVALSGRAVLGDVLALIGGLAAAVYVTVGAVARTRLPTDVHTAVCYTVCAVVLVLACAVGGVRLAGWDGGTWLKLVAVTVCAQLLGHSLINVVLRSTSPTVVGLVLLLEVPGASLVALVWLHQRPPLSAVPGLVLLFAGLVLVARAGGRDAPVELTE